MKEKSSKYGKVQIAIISSQVMRAARKTPDCTVTLKPGPSKVLGDSLLFIATEEVCGKERAKERSSVILLTDENHGVGSFTASLPVPHYNSLNPPVGRKALHAPNKEFVRILRFVKARNPEERKVLVLTKGGRKVSVLLEHQRKGY